MKSSVELVVWHFFGLFYLIWFVFFYCFIRFWCVRSVVINFSVHGKRENVSSRFCYISDAILLLSQPYSGAVYFVEWQNRVRLWIIYESFVLLCRFRLVVVVVLTSFLYSIHFIGFIGIHHIFALQLCVFFHFQFFFVALSNEIH